MHHKFTLTVLAAILVMLAAVPAGYYYASAQESTVPAVADPALRVEDVVGGLERPTTMAFLDQDTILVLEKDRGTVRVVENGVLQDEPLLDVAVANENERGMLGIAVSKENDTTTYVFLYFTESGGGSDGDDSQGIEPAGNRLYRFELENGELVSIEAGAQGDLTLSAFQHDHGADRAERRREDDFAALPGRAGHAL